jgi:hypothetical protein
MLPNLLILGVAVIGATQHGLPGFFIGGFAAWVAMLALGWVLRRMHPTPKVYVIDSSKGMYSVGDGLVVKPLMRSPDCMSLECAADDKVMTLFVFPADRLYRLIEDGLTVKAGSYKNNLTIGAIANYFVEAPNNIWQNDGKPTELERQVASWF